MMQTNDPQFVRQPLVRIDTSGATLPISPSPQILIQSPTPSPVVITPSSVSPTNISIITPGNINNMSNKCYLDGRYFNLVLQDYIASGVVCPNKSIVTLNYGPGLSDISETFNIKCPVISNKQFSRLIIGVNKADAGIIFHSTVLEIDAGTVKWFDPISFVGRKGRSLIYSDYKNSVIGILGTLYKGMIIEQVQHSITPELGEGCDPSTGYCVAYGIQYVLQRLIEKEGTLSRANNILTNIISTPPAVTIVQFSRNIEQLYGGFLVGQAEVEYGPGPRFGGGGRSSIASAGRFNTRNYGNINMRRGDGRGGGWGGRDGRDGRDGHHHHYHGHYGGYGRRRYGGLGGFATGALLGAALGSSLGGGYGYGYGYPYPYYAPYPVYPYYPGYIV